MAGYGIDGLLDLIHQIVDIHKPELLTSLLMVRQDDRGFSLVDTDLSKVADDLMGFLILEKHIPDGDIDRGEETLDSIHIALNPGKTRSRLKWRHDQPPMSVWDATAIYGVRCNRK